MKTMKNLVKMMLMSVATAATVLFTACSDDLGEMTTSNNPQPANADAALLEAYGLTFENFDNVDDVIILDADTTQLSVSKAYAEKMGITSFVNHPMGIWHAMEQLPYIRKATAQELVGDRYILTVVPATVAEIIGDKQVNLQTDIYVNNDPSAVQTRAAGANLPEYAAKYMDDNNVIHPAVIHLTDPFGYDKGYHFNDDQPSASQTRAAASGEYQYMTAEELASGQTRWGVHRRLLGINTELEKKFKFAAKGSKDSVYVKFGSEVDFELNYFITLEGGIKWDYIIPSPYVEKFETGVDGHFNLDAEVEFGFEKKLSLEDLLKFEICKFQGYSFTFFVGPVPVLINVNPNMFIKFDGEVSGKITTGFKYEYGNEFMGGARYTDGKGWEGLGYFKETANKFSVLPARTTFKFSTGMGIYLGADIMLYGCAGPEFSVGPHLGGKLEAVVSPFDAASASDIVDFKGQIDLSINAVLGAKLSLLGYNLAETQVTIPMAGPWILAKYPSDGTEHKVGDTEGVTAAQPVVVEWKNFYKKAGDNFNAEMKQVINMLREIYNYSEAQARQMVVERIQKGWDYEPEVNNAILIDVWSELDKYKKEVEEQYYNYQYQKAGETGDYQWINAENWRRICQEITSKFRLYSEDSVENAMNNIHRWFQVMFQREPSIASAEDMAWLVDRFNNYSKYKWEYRQWSL